MFVMSVTPVHEPAAETSSFLQTSFWRSFKEHFGWRGVFFSVEWQNSNRTSLLILLRPLTRFLTIAYVPWGPDMDASLSFQEYGAALAELASKLKPLLPHTVFCLRFDPPWTNNTEPFVMPVSFRRAVTNIQAPDTIVVSLQESEDAILAQMKSKWRYNIRLAAKHIRIEQADEAGLEVFYQIFLETARRDGIAVHHISYYQKLFCCAQDHCKDTPAPLVRLYLAWCDNTALAGIITLFWGKQAVYLYGASSNKNRNLMPTYLLQWRAMQDARNTGCTSYDLFGIPPNDDPAHPMAGLYRFKTGFGGTIIHRPGCYDYPCSFFVYLLFRTVEKIRKTILNKRKQRKTSNNAD
jgi:lipid II:glycine glycyltransferase (peptidoglycan interpeptide bridge formation enzyme)